MLATLLVFVSQKPSITFVKTPTLKALNRHYRSNQYPLEATPLIKLPIRSIEAKGWLREYLKRQRTGMTGQLPHISAWLKKEGNAWLDKNGNGKAGWEEVPYWLKGYISLAYQLEDRAMIAEAKSWIEAAIKSQRPNGDFGPNQKLEDGSRDFWGNMLMLNCLRTYYEATQDPRVVELMTKYFHYQLTIPDNQFLTGYWQRARGGDNLASIYWLFNITEDKTLLELAEKNHRCTMNWSMPGTLPDWHNVNVAQSFDEPAIYSQQSNNKANIKSAYDNFFTIRRMYGQVPGGMFGADENARKGRFDPRQAIETCGMVEQMQSDEELLAITGDTLWADHCENVAFNTYPAAVTPDFTALRYLTSPNMATSDRYNHASGFQNDGPMTMFNPLSHRCCQHNHSHGWPYFSENLWMASNDRGLVATMYSASRVGALVGDGSYASIEEETNYPFEESIRFTVESRLPNRFPLYLRIPSWCNKPTLSINGQKIALGSKSSGYVRIERTWKGKESVTLGLPMRITTTVWQENQNSVSVVYGPLTFSLKIAEQITKADSAKTALHDSKWQGDLNTAKWPAFEYMPKSPWNYALAIDPKNPAASLKVVKKAWPKSGFPFTPGEVPITIQAKGAILPEWKIDRYGLVAPLQSSPTKSAKPTQTIELVPMGAARLRISAFPWLAVNGKVWTEPKNPLPYLPKASHVFGGDTLEALCDQLLPTSSADETVPRFTWWDHKGTQEWVQYDFKKAMKVQKVGVYWFDDTGKGMCRVPKYWKILCKVGGQWVPIPTKQTHGTATDTFNCVEINPIEVTSLRLEVQMQDGFSAGILEWQIR